MVRLESTLVILFFLLSFSLFADDYTDLNQLDGIWWSGIHEGDFHPRASYICFERINQNEYLVIYVDNLDSNDNNHIATFTINYDSDVQIIETDNKTFYFRLVPYESTARKEREIYIWTGNIDAPEWTFFNFVKYADSYNSQ